MTREEIDAVLDRVKTWPVERQAHAAFLLIGFEREAEEPLEMSDEDRVAVEEALREEERGEFASDAEVQAVFDRYRSR
jgi:hypothetical protein